MTKRKSNPSEDSNPPDELEVIQIDGNVLSVPDIIDDDTLPSIETNIDESDTIEPIFQIIPDDLMGVAEHLIIATMNSLPDFPNTEHWELVKMAMPLVGESEDAIANIDAINAQLRRSYFEDNFELEAFAFVVSQVAIKYILTSVSRAYFKYFTQSTR